MTRTSTSLAIVAALAFASPALGQPSPSPSPTWRPGSSPMAGSPDVNTPRPIAAYDSVFMEELTWMEVRDAMRAGKRTAIVATGGIEQNGPYLAAGKHNYVLRATTDAIARKLGNALVAPIVGFVPEGDLDPPSGMMRYPSTVSVSQDTFKRLLADICVGLKSHGFEHIILIGDSGGNQTGMKETAADLTMKWKGAGTTIHFIPEYTDYPGLTDWLKTQGVNEVDEGLHDDFGITSIIMTVDPQAVRLKERIAAGKASINGVPIAPADRAIALGRKAVEYRASVTVDAIRKALNAGTR